jgi:TusA-related sulfurtransferase
MKNIILLLLTWSSVFAQQQENEIIKFAGIYETKCEIVQDDDEGEKSFLRFYPDKKVISVGTDCDATAEDLKEWFNLENKSLSVGNYEVKGEKISFSTTNASGTVNYKGCITKEGVLKLKTKSLINGYKSREEYQFIKVTDLK